MIVVAIVGGVFAALAVGSVWLRTQDPDELREMGMVLGYKDEQMTLTAERPASQPAHRRHTWIKRTSHARPHPASARGYWPVHPV